MSGCTVDDATRVDPATVERTTPVSSPEAASVPVTVLPHCPVCPFVIDTWARGEAVDPHCVFACATCGDGVCNNGETNSTCPGDCPPPAPSCGDGICQSTETSTSCPSDCAPSSVCGDGICDFNEIVSCPSDCNSACPSLGSSIDPDIRICPVQ